jgi:hypothetical protein
METLKGCHIKTANDALVLFEACRTGILYVSSISNNRKRVSRRLNDQERSRYISSGSVFIWDEAESGIKRQVQAFSNNYIAGLTDYHGAPRVSLAPFLYTERSMVKKIKKDLILGQPTKSIRITSLTDSSKRLFGLSLAEGSAISSHIIKIVMRTMDS